MKDVAAEAMKAQAGTGAQTADTTARPAARKTAARKPAAKKSTRAR
jgi:hypothetical protein